MKLKITTLIENQAAEDDRLTNEHGLSLLIEFDGKKVLFDTGQSGAFVENASLLHKNLEEVDFFCISHGHYDHAGGVEHFVETVNNRPKMYVGCGFFVPKYKTVEDGSFHFNGVAFSKEMLRRQGFPLTEVTEDVTYLTDKILLFKNFERTNKFEQLNKKFFLKKEGEMVRDAFLDEIVLGLLTEKGLVVVAGCSHAGIVNILTAIKERTKLPIFMVIGGTHLIDADEERLTMTANAFSQLGISNVAVSHCTGEKGMYCLHNSFKQHFCINNTGKVLKI